MSYGAAGVRGAGITVVSIEPGDHQYRVGSHWGRGPPVGFRGEDTSHEGVEEAVVPEQGRWVEVCM